MFIQSDVIAALEPNDELTFDLVFVVSPGFYVLKQGQSHLIARGAQSFDVFDLCFDCCEVTHLSFLSDLLCVAIETFGKLSM